MIIHTLTNLVLISLPEEVFVTCMILVLFKRFDLLDTRMWRQNLKWILIPSVAMSTSISVFKYIIILPKLLTSTISLLILWITIYYIIRKTSMIKENKIIIKAIVYSLITLLLISIIEIIYIPLTLKLIKIPYEMFNQNIVYMFILALPSRILEFSIIIFFVVKMNEQVNVKLYNVIFKNKPLTRITIFIISFLTLFLMDVIKLISYNGIFSNLSLFEQLFTTSIILSLPTIFLAVLWYMINYIIGMDKRIEQMSKYLED